LRGPTPTRIERWLALGAAVAAAIAWFVWFRAGLVLSHYDAKAHLVVARRVIDNLTPGWQQIGAVWLPLPHLINVLPTQIDVFYRTGIFASAVSIACFGVTAWAAALMIRRATGSAAGMATATLLLTLNPNLLYLHATPMTEPLLFAACFLAVLWLEEWLWPAEAGPDVDSRASAATRPIPWKLHAVLFAAAWTRYEAWLVVTAALILTAVILLRRHEAVSQVAATVARLAAWPAVAFALFLLNSRVTVGSWFVSNGFYVPDPTYERLIAKSALAVWWGTHQMSGYVTEIVALATAGVIIVRGRPVFVTLALLAPAALPFYAFVEGHPFRIRYMIPLVTACALLSGLAVGLLESRGGRSKDRPLQSVEADLQVGLARRAAFAWLAAAVLVFSLVIESPPWLGSRAPLIAESEWDVPRSLERRGVTRCLAPAYHGEKILASMGSLAHYMQELASAGLGIADFINEGNGTLWTVAFSTGPAQHAGWMLVEEEAEGGDVLAQRIRADASFARGMTRVCEGGGVTLYGRTELVASHPFANRPATPR
jgi:hypothetical protein